MKKHIHSSECHLHEWQVQNVHTYEAFPTTCTTCTTWDSDPARQTTCQKNHFDSHLSSPSSPYLPPPSLVVERKGGSRGTSLRHTRTPEYACCAARRNLAPAVADDFGFLHISSPRNNRSCWRRQQGSVSPTQLPLIALCFQLICHHELFMHATSSSRARLSCARVFVCVYH